MTTSRATEPWRALPASVADVIEPELSAVTGEILASIAEEVPEYARPLEGSFGRVILPAACSACHGLIQGRTPCSRSAMILPVMRL